MIKRVFVSKKEKFDTLSNSLLNDFINNLGLLSLNYLKVYNCYDVEGLSDKQFKKAVDNVFSEPFVDDVFYNINKKDKKIFGYQFVDGQFDQRAFSATQCLEAIIKNNNFKLKCSYFYVINEDINEIDLKNLKKYLINKADSKEISIDIPKLLDKKITTSKQIYEIEGFNNFTENQLKIFSEKNGLSLNIEDLKYIQSFFANKEKRNPTDTEIRIIDTYWSDHCRHTTFLTEIERVDIEDVEQKKVWEKYLEDRKALGLDKKNKFPSLMEMATFMSKKLNKQNKINDVVFSEEVNACTIEREISFKDNKKEKWLILFKNETHNHPTEIEPFGGASTCVGGAIRDPLSGRAYVYQSMRISGSADPRQAISETISGKLPQRKITKEAAFGFSSYGNQIGLNTGYVDEIYHPNYVAKRLEVGAVIGAVPKKNVVIKKPKEGDVVILLGGKTGIDGCGGASGSSKSHNEKSLDDSNHEVQKGNPPEERKIQRLFKNPKVTKLIKRCNDFGAGGVCVAVGEIADSLEIYLDKIPKKYEGLNGTQLAISESQERMAVVVNKKNATKFINYSFEENLEATIIAEVKNNNRVVFIWNNTVIANLDRSFLNTNGTKQKTKVFIKEAKETEQKKIYNSSKNVLKCLSDLNVCSKKGLIEMFDSSVGAKNVLAPLGGKYQLTPQEGMVSLIPSFDKEPTTTSLVTYGFDPYRSSENPYKGAISAVVNSLSKMVCLGANYNNVRFSFQEYYEKLLKNPLKWSKPFSALLGAYKVLDYFELPAIGGKDSMSGTYKEINVPPTFISFAFNTQEYKKIISSELKSNKTYVYILKNCYKNEEINLDNLKANFDFFIELNNNNKILSSKTVGSKGIFETISKMCFGNKIGIDITNDKLTLFEKGYSDIIFETTEKFEETSYLVKLGNTNNKGIVKHKNFEYKINELIEIWSNPLKNIFKETVKNNFKVNELKSTIKKYSNISKYCISKPRVLIPVFPGTNSEYETKQVFEKYGAKVEFLIINNQEKHYLKESINNLSKKINNSQIIVFPGGFSAGDEPEGAAKYIVNIIKNKKIKNNIHNFLDKNDGLILGICNGFQVLTKSGLLTNSKITPAKKVKMSLIGNKINKHISKIVNTKVVSINSPWMSKYKLGEVYSVPVSHSEGRFECDKQTLDNLIKNNNICFQYCNKQGVVNNNFETNPNGSVMNIEGVFSADGKILGKMGHSERINNYVPKNINQNNQEHKLFESGVYYFS